MLVHEGNFCDLVDDGNPEDPVVVNFNEIILGKGNYIDKPYITVKFDKANDFKHPAKDDATLLLVKTRNFEGEKSNISTLAPCVYVYSSCNRCMYNVDSPLIGLSRENALKLNTLLNFHFIILKKYRQYTSRFYGIRTTSRYNVPGKLNLHNLELIYCFDIPQEKINKYDMGELFYGSKI